MALDTAPAASAASQGEPPEAPGAAPATRTTDPPRQSQINRPAERPDAPLGFAQRQAWLLARLRPDLPLGNAPLLFAIAGPLQPAALERALNMLLRRHEALRAAIDDSSGEARQTVAPRQSIPFVCSNLRRLPAEERADETARLIASQAALPFNLRRGPLIRALLLILEGERAQLLLTIHRLAFDPWSIDVLLHDLAALYAAASRSEGSRSERAPAASQREHRAPALPPLVLQAPAIAEWQRGSLHSAPMAPSLDYWRHQLPAILAAPPLAMHGLPGLPQPTALSHRGASARRAIPAALLRSLELFSQRAGASLLMTMVAAFHALLHRRGGQDEITVGVLTANRDRPEMDDLIGCFAHTLPLRVDLRGNPRFADFLGRVRRAALAAFAHQDAPIEEIAAELAGDTPGTYEWVRGKASLCQAAFALQSMALPAVESAGAGFTFAGEAENGTARYELLLSVEQRADGPLLTAEYSTDLFDQPAIALLLEQYTAILAAVAADPAARLGELPLPAAENRPDAEAQALLSLERGCHP